MNLLKKDCKFGFILHKLIHMDFKILKTELADNVLIVTISRPEALNALNTLFFKEMEHLINHLPAEAKVMIITGEGKAFVAGADISEMVEMTPAEGEAFSLMGQHIFNQLENLNIPVIAAVNGFALGGGCELAMACDFRYASSTAKFGQPEVNLGLIPGYAGTQRLSRLVGMGSALHLILSTEAITAEEAQRIGLVQKVIEPAQLMDEALKTAKAITSKGPKAVALAKQVIRNGREMNFNNACALEAKEFGTLFKNEAEEGMRAFLEKRKPNW